ncbi:MAG: class I SAM-dependent DNA methyltransferase [Thermoanaerobaculia bacterium]
MTATDLNREYYEATNAGRDDYWRLMAAPRRRVQMILRLIGEVPEATSVVDVGCGNGVLLEEIRRRYPRLRLTGIDLSHAQIEINRARDATIEWIAADAQQSATSSLDNRFDIVVTSEVIEHLDDPETFIRNAARLASRERGRLILTTQSGTISETERRVGHVHHFPASEMRDLLQRNGWNGIRVWNEGFPFHNLSKWFAGRNADKMMQRFDSRAYGPAERFACWMLRAAFLFNSRRRGAQLYAVAAAPSS